MNHNHQRPEYVHSYGQKSQFAFREVIFNRKREWIIQDPVAFTERHPVLLDICGFLLRVEFE